MGLFSKGEKVQGWAQIVSTSMAPHNAVSGTCRMNVILQAEGTPAIPIETSKICRVSKWPRAGMRLPCEFDPNKPEKFDIDWSGVESWQDQARRQAEMMAQQMNQPGRGGMPAGIPGMPGNVQVINLSGGEADPAKIARAEQMLGIDIDGDGRIGAPPAGAAPPPPPPPGAPPPALAPMTPDDRVDALERLAALHEKGLLTAAEFAAEKQRLLSS